MRTERTAQDYERFHCRVLMQAGVPLVDNPPIPSEAPRQMSKAQVLVWRMLARDGRLPRRDEASPKRRPSSKNRNGANRYLPTDAA